MDNHTPADAGVLGPRLREQLTPDQIPHNLLILRRVSQWAQQIEDGAKTQLLSGTKRMFHHGVKTGQTKTRYRFYMQEATSSGPWSTLPQG